MTVSANMPLSLYKFSQTAQSKEKWSSLWLSSFEMFQKATRLKSQRFIQAIVFYPTDTRISNLSDQIFWNFPQRSIRDVMPWHFLLHAISKRRNGSRSKHSISRTCSGENIPRNSETDSTWISETKTWENWVNLQGPGGKRLERHVGDYLNVGCIWLYQLCLYTHSNAQSHPV